MAYMRPIYVSRARAASAPAGRNPLAETAAQRSRAAVSGEKEGLQSAGPPRAPGEDAPRAGAEDRNQIRDDARRASEENDEGLHKLYGTYDCQTCKNRKYQDGSDDPGVSFKTPRTVTPQAAASAVRGHEMEHVFRERAKAMREDSEVLSQSIVLHTGVCPECGGVYISGGTTRTVTRKSSEVAEVLRNNRLKGQTGSAAGQTARAV